MAATTAPLRPDELRKVTRPAGFVYRFLRGIGAILSKLLWRYEVVGRDRLPTVGPFVLSPVHRSNVDFLLAGLSVKRRVRFMAKDSLWGAPRFGRFLDAMGAFPVNRRGGDRTALRRAEEALAAGEPVVMFPEGQRRDGPIVQELHQGPAFVACRQRVPIVPVGIGGSDRAMPKYSKMIRLTKVKVVIGEPIYPDVPLTGRVPRAAVTDTTEKLKGAIQELYDQVR